MTTTYKITNIVPNLETNELVAFYKFSNGEVLSNRYPIETPAQEIMAWGSDKCIWFDEREHQVEEIKIAIAEESRKLLEEQSVVEVVEEVITE